MAGTSNPDWREHDGLAFFREVIAGRQPQAPMDESVPFRPIAAGEGWIHFRTCADLRHRNPFGTVHGGFVATVLDAATACAVHTRLPRGKLASTIDFQMKLMRPVSIGDELHAEGRVINLSRRLGVAEATLKDGAGKLYAHATATCMILESDPSE